MKTLKKQELIEMLVSKDVRSTNLRSAMRIKSIGDAVEKKGFDQVSGWLSEIERQDRIKEAQKMKASKAKSFNMSVKEYDQLTGKAAHILREFNTGHSMGCWKHLSINGKILQKIDATDEYAKSSRWTAKHGSFTIDLTKKALREIQNIEGVWTIPGKDGKASWLEGSGYKGSYKVGWTHGFLYKESHSTESLEHAIELQKRKDEITERAIQKNSRFVGVQHIRSLGACTQGIKAFCDRHNLDPELGYNVGYLKSFNDVYAQRYLNAV